MGGLKMQGPLYYQSPLIRLPYLQKNVTTCILEMWSLERRNNLIHLKFLSTKDSCHITGRIAYTEQPIRVAPL